MHISMNSSTNHILILILKNVLTNVLVEVSSFNLSIKKIIKDQLVKAKHKIV